MDLGTLIGLAGGLGLIIFGIIVNKGNIMSYIDPGSAVLVIGGSLMGMLVATGLPRMMGIMKYVKILLNVPSYEEEKIIAGLVNFSEKARREGLLALEDDLEEVEE